MLTVGAGSAGGIVAARLSEDDHHTVALLEAGPDDADYPDVDVPKKYFDLENTDVDWSYRTVPQNNSCWGLKERVSSNIGHTQCVPAGGWVCVRCSGFFKI